MDITGISGCDQSVCILCPSRIANQGRESDTKTVALHIVKIRSFEFDPWALALRVSPCRWNDTAKKLVDGRLLK